MSEQRGDSVSKPRHLPSEVGFKLMLILPPYREWRGRVKDDDIGEEGRMESKRLERFSFVLIGCHPEASVPLLNPKQYAGLSQSIHVATLYTSTSMSGARPNR